MANAIFPPYNEAIEFHNACARWAPLDPQDQRKGSIWPLQDALPWMRDAILEICNGYSRVVVTCERTLDGGLKPPMREAMVRVWNALANASKEAQTLEKTFTQVYAEAINRKNLRGGHTMNV